MANYYAKNIQWSGLLPDNTVEATFDVYNDQGVELYVGTHAKGNLEDIQQIIGDKLKAKANALDLYSDITANTELVVPMD